VVCRFRVAAERLVLTNGMRTSVSTRSRLGFRWPASGLIKRRVSHRFCKLAFAAYNQVLKVKAVSDQRSSFSLFSGKNHPFRADR
jgi:hypothetical protein